MKDTRFEPGHARLFDTWGSAIVKSRLSPTARHVALTLALHTDAGLQPTGERLSRATGLTTMQVSRGLKELEQGRWITRKERGFGIVAEYGFRIPSPITEEEDG